MLDTYRNDVFRLMEMGSNEIILNDQPQHAATLFECFFVNAKTNVKILCRDLDPRVFDTPSVLGAASDAVSRGVALDIIVQQQPSEESKFLKLVAEFDGEAANRVSCKLNAGAHSDVVATMSENFAVMDRKAVRYEPNSHAIKAQATMNQPLLADKLTAVFFRIKNTIRQ